jgi:hypothetical protein
LNNSVADKADQRPELDSLREENRRLYLLVERLIATQESEQEHRKTIEAGLDEVKLSLEQRAVTEGAGDEAPTAHSEPSEDITGLVQELGKTLEDKFSSKMDALENSLSALVGAHSKGAPQGQAGPEDLAEVAWKIIAPLGEELERLSGMVVGLGQRLDKLAAGPAQEAAAISQRVELKKLLEEMARASSDVLARSRDQIENDRKAMQDVLDTRLAEVGKSVSELSARHEDTQAQTLSLLRELVDSHVGRLSADWSAQISSLKRALDDLRLELVSRLDTAADGDGTAATQAGSEAVMEPEVPSVAADEVIPNVVTGDFPAFHRASADPDQATRRHDDVVAEEFEIDVSEFDDSEVEDALLTQPADWRTGADADEGAINLSLAAVNAHDADQAGKDGKAEGAVSGALRANEPEAAEKQPDRRVRGIDLRAYKDLRLSCEPGEVEDMAAKAATGTAGNGYENAPAEASLTRFVRLIRARKRTTPS